MRSPHRAALVLVGSLFLCTGQAAAQPHVGAIAGLTAANVGFDINGTNATFDSRTGLFGGVTLVDRLPRGPLCLEIDALIAPAGTTVDVGAPLDIALHYFSIPVLARYDHELMPRRFVHLLAGVALDVKVREAVTFDDIEQTELDVFRRTAASFVFGGGVDIGRWRVDLRATRGLTDVSAPNDNLRGIDFSLKSNTVMIGVGYDLKWW